MIIVILLIAYAAWQGTAEPAETGPIKLGVSMPLTGEAASLGIAAMAGINTALKEINQAGGVNGRLIQLVVEDDKCSKDGSTTINKLINFDKVVALIGPLCSAAAGPGLPIAQREKVPTIFFGSAPALTKLGDYLFRTYPSDSMQGAFAADFIFNQLKKTKVAVLYVKNDWGQGLHDVFAERFQQLGGEIVYDDSFLADAKDLRTVVLKTKAADPEVIYFPAYPAVAAVGLRQMKEIGIAVPIIGGDAFSADEIIQNSAAEGALFTMAVIKNPADFVEKVKAVAGEDVNLNWMAPLGYDALNIFAEVIARVGTDKQAMRDALAGLTYEKGIASEKIEFDQNGDLKEAAFEVREIKDKEAVLWSE